MLVKIVEMYSLQHGDFLSDRKKDPDANKDMNTPYWIGWGMTWEVLFCPRPLILDSDSRRFWRIRLKELKTLRDIFQKHFYNKRLLFRNPKKMDSLNSNFSRGFWAQTRIFSDLSSCPVFYPPFSILQFRLFMSRLEFSCFAEFFVWIFKTREEYRFL